MTILVTGGAGFIGSHLVARLLSSNKQVRVLDNLSSGKADHLPSHPMLQFLHADVRDIQAVREATRGVSTIVHLAAIASVEKSIEDPSGCHGTNFVGTLNLLEAASDAGIGTFVYASSAAVYGDTGVPPLREDSPVQPLSPYAVDKLAGELYCGIFVRQRRLAATALRFFNVYGPRQDPDSPYSGVLSIFSKRALAGTPVTIFGDGEQTRDFVHVADVVEAIARAIANPSGMQTVNVGSGAGLSLLQILSAFEQILGARVATIHRDQRPGDIRHSVADISTMRRLLQFAPKIPIQAGLRDLFSWMNEQD